MGERITNIMVIPPENLADRIIPEAMKAHLEKHFPGYSFTIDNMSSLPGDYYGFVQLPNSEGEFEAPRDEDYPKILATLRAYGDGRSMLQ